MVVQNQYNDCTELVQGLYADFPRRKTCNTFAPELRN
nr:MAG TPA: hypothetical protein [Caudoviricetes sp.]